MYLAHLASKEQGVTFDLEVPERDE